MIAALVLGLVANSFPVLFVFKPSATLVAAPEGWPVVSASIIHYPWWILIVLDIQRLSTSAVSPTTSLENAQARWSKAGLIVAASIPDIIRS